MANSTFIGRFIFPIISVFFFAIALPVSETQAKELSDRRDIPAMHKLSVLRVDGTEIYASISTPKARRFPVLLYLQGSGCASELESLASLTEPWRRRFAFLYIEKPGIIGSQESCTKEFITKYTIDARMWDIQRVIQVLRNNPRWNRKLYVIGVSEGGLLSGLTAAFVPEVQRVAILSYGGGLTIGEWWPDVAYQGVLKETGSSEKAEQERNEVLSNFASARLNPSFTETFSGETNTSAYWASIVDIRLQHALLDVSIPIALYHGDRDEMSPVVGARRLNDAFIAARKTNLHYNELRGFNHGLEDIEGKSRLQETISNALDWLLQR